MRRQRFVEFTGDAVQRVQACPGDGREIVMFVVQADVVGEDIQGAVVGVGFWGLDFAFLGLFAGIV